VTGKEKSNKLVWIVVLIPVVVALSLPVLSGVGLAFWSTSYQLFLGSMLIVPPMLLHDKGRLVRFPFLLACLALFGFLQMACPRPPGAVELLIISLQKGNPWLMFAIKLGVLLVLTLIFGRYFCSHICPKGAIQELVFRQRLRLQVPAKLDRVLKYAKYVAAVALIAAPLLFHFRFFRAIGPFKVIFNLDGSTALVVFLGVVLLASVVIGRPFCRYLCPIGGLLALASLLSPLKTRVDTSLCNACKVCQRVCPVDAIEVVEGNETKKISASECLECRECAAVCPKGAIYYGPRRNPRPVVDAPKQ
jgi:polyferredoxin